MRGDELVMFAVLVVGIVALAVVHLARRRLQAKRRMSRDAMTLRLAERFGEGDAFVAFARSPEGRVLMENEYAPAAMAHRILGLLQFGIVACAIGVAFLVNGVAPPAGADINLVREADEARWWGWLAIGLGIGLVIASGVSAAIARKWRVLGD
ncbi:hypothetical protein LF41_2103 [Lysobacter dokdonensis DS-58]|uniref:Transmembrane protein n=1 Tax=Lysobacter dokdonensis DS-58 TaxID=1300345 RepID=A0A0A2X4L4_9GAMM|nr:hypothetical protein [Lysobacter dokdonensis]KGQ20149.1 hypothetical protein LF41_2103 [Lysobacter dokdonensis DS-58]